MSICCQNPAPISYLKQKLLLLLKMLMMLLLLKLYHFDSLLSQYIQHKHIAYSRNDLVMESSFRSSVSVFFDSGQCRSGGWFLSLISVSLSTMTFLDFWVSVFFYLFEVWKCAQMPRHYFFNLILCCVLLCCFCDNVIENVTRNSISKATK